MGAYSKAIGAAIGGGLAGTAALPLMPDNTPWYGYLVLYALTQLPTLLTYFFPKNTA